MFQKISTLRKRRVKKQRDSPEEGHFLSFNGQEIISWKATVELINRCIRWEWKRRRRQGGLEKGNFEKRSTHTGRELSEHQLNALQTPADSLGG